MAVITSVNRARFMQEEMDRRSGIKPTVKQANPYTSETTVNRLTNNRQWTVTNIVRQSLTRL